jgi:hypothetical protein
MSHLSFSLLPFVLLFLLFTRVLSVLPVTHFIHPFSLTGEHRLPSKHHAPAVNDTLLKFVVFLYRYQLKHAWKRCKMQNILVVRYEGKNTTWEG